ncbi:MAG: DNA polymerase III subunit alpha [Candidatus Atribacteria bacterium]|nr:DNA polymerase III subunit alpha [Candidatus Atribacteria bacterium]
MSFIHLHLHSHYSLQDGLGSIEEIISKAWELKMKAIALTDHDGLYGAIEFYKKSLSAGIKPIIGCELRIKSEYLFSYPTYLVLLAQDNTGYRNLCQLITHAHLSNPKSIPAIDRNTLSRYHEGLIILSGCLQGEIPTLITQKEYQKAEIAALWYKKIFGPDHFYLEVSFHGLTQEHIINRYLIDLGEKLSIPIVATNNVHYLDSRQYHLQNIINKIANQSTRECLHYQPLPNSQYYLKSDQEMKDLFSFFPKALRNTEKIAEECNVRLELGKIQLPSYRPPENYSATEYLEKLCLEGLKKYYPDPSSQAFYRMKYELQVIHQMGFAGYFLIVRDIVQFAKKDNIPVGPGKGSAAGSLVSYLLNITEVDPLKFKLFFERFLNPQRIDLPDIDIDFGQIGRDRVIHYMFQKFGREQVTHVCTINTYAARSAIRDTGRALGFSYQELNKIAKMMPFFSSPGVISSSLRNLPEFRQLPYQKEPLRSLLWYAQFMEGKPHHLSVHASAMIIADQPLSNLIPLELSPDGEIISQYEKESIKEIGLLKIDILGSRNLTVIQKTLQSLGENKMNIHLKQIPLDDPSTFYALKKGKTLGVFQLESAGMTSLLKQLSPSCLEDLIAALSLYRPGPLDSGMTEQYLKIKNGYANIEYPHDRLREVLKDTYGVILYQEQVMQAVSAFAGLTLGEADLFRRAISSRSPAIMEEQRTRFLEKSMEQGITKKEAEKIFNLVAKFAYYGFNKAHSTSYALLSYLTCYLKVHYPAHYLAALLTYGTGYYDSDRYIQEARRFRVQILLPDINKSQVGFSVEANAIRIGLIKIKGMGMKQVSSILKIRNENGPFLSLYHFCARTHSIRINRTAIENLIKVGAFDFTRRPRSVLLNLLPLILKETEKEKNSANIYKN